LIGTVFVLCISEIGVGGGCRPLPRPVRSDFDVRWVVWLFVAELLTLLPVKPSILWIACLLIGLLGHALAAEPPRKPGPTMAEVLSATHAAHTEDWRQLDPENTLYLELSAGRVVIELAPAFATRHVALDVRATTSEFPVVLAMSAVTRSPDATFRTAMLAGR
jgi:hypothetical protein